MPPMTRGPMTPDREARRAELAAAAHRIATGATPPATNPDVATLRARWRAIFARRRRPPRPPGAPTGAR